MCPCATTNNLIQGNTHAINSSAYHPGRRVRLNSSTASSVRPPSPSRMNFTILACAMNNASRPRSYRGRLSFGVSPSTVGVCVWFEPLDASTCHQPLEWIASLQSRARAASAGIRMPTASSTWHKMLIRWLDVREAAPMHEGRCGCLNF